MDSLIKRLKLTHLVLLIIVLTMLTYFMLGRAITWAWLGSFPYNADYITYYTFKTYLSMYIAVTIAAVDVICIRQLFHLIKKGNHEKHI